MISWDGKESLQDHWRLHEYEKHMAGGIAFNSSQAAITACLEVLGSRFQPISVIMPVNVSYDALMGVIRANARPIVCDIDEWTLQANPEQVSSALKDAPEAIVLLNRPGGRLVDEKLLEVVQEVPTICDSRMLPLEEIMLFTFNVYDISVMVGSGAVVYLKNEEQASDLKQIRADSKVELSEVNAALAYKRQPLMSDYPDGSEYMELLDSVGKFGIIGISGNTPLPTFLIKVKDSKLILDYFAQRRVQLAYGSIPVYKYPIARKRWQQEPNYKIAEKMHGQLVLLPNHEGVNRARCLEEIWKVLDE